MDVLSEVLETVRLDGAMFYNAEFSSPWCFRSPRSSMLSPYLSGERRHVIIFHLLTEGRGYAHVEGDGRPVALDAGDIVIFPHGDPHILGNGPPVTPVDNARELERLLSLGLKLSRMGGGGELTKFICGYMTCEPQLSSVFLGGLPPLMKVNIRNGPSGQWLEHSLRYSVDNADPSSPGAEAVLAKLSEVLFVETLRRYIELLPPEQTGWLAGVRDPEIGKALALLHQKPAHPWTIASLGSEIGDLTFGPRRTIPAVSVRESHGLSCTMASAAGRAAAQIHEPQRSGNCRRGRLRIGTLLQSRLQTAVWPPTGPLPEPVTGGAPHLSGRDIPQEPSRRQKSLNIGERFDHSSLP